MTTTKSRRSFDDAAKGKGLDDGDEESETLDVTVWCREALMIMMRNSENLRRRCQVQRSLEGEAPPRNLASEASPTKLRLLCRLWLLPWQRGSPRPPSTSGPSWNQLRNAAPQVVCIGLQQVWFCRHDTRPEALEKWFGGRTQK